jgi:hypothetical protein
MSKILLEQVGEIFKQVYSNHLIHEEKRMAPQMLPFFSFFW